MIDEIINNPITERGFVPDYDIYYNINEALTYQNCLWYMILGNRGCGKSWDAKRHGIERFLQYGEQFAYIRRTEKDIERTNHKFFNDMYDYFVGVEMKVVGDQYIINGKVAGYCYALSTSMSIKGAPVPWVDFIIYDEFLIDPEVEHQRYFKNEVYLLQQIYESIARPMRGKKRVPMVMLANIYESVNPYFLKLEVHIPYNKKNIFVNKKRHIYLQIIDNEKHREEKNQSMFGELVADTDYAETSIKGNFIRDKDAFIMKDRPSKLKYLFTLRAGGQSFGVYLAKELGIYYISKKFNPTCQYIITTIFEDHSPNVMLLKSIRKNEFFSSLKKGYEYSLIRYDSLESQNAVLTSMKGSM